MRDSAGSVVPIFVGKTIRHTKFHNTSSINTPLVIIRSVVVKQKPTHHSRFERSSDCCGRGECGSCSCSCCPASGVSTGRASGLQFRRIPGGHFGGGRRTTDRRRIFKKWAKINLRAMKNILVQIFLASREPKEEFHDSDCEETFSSIRELSFSEFLKVKSSRNFSYLNWMAETSYIPMKQKERQKLVDFSSRKFLHILLLESIHSTENNIYNYKAKLYLSSFMLTQSSILLFAPP